MAAVAVAHNDRGCSRAWGPGGFCRLLSRGLWVGWSGGFKRWSGLLLVIAQQKPARWRATATATSVLRFPRWVSRRCQMWWRRCWAFQEIAIRRRAGLVGGAGAWALAGRAAVVPGRFDEEPAGVAGAGLGDRALPSLLAGAVLGGDEPEVVHQLRGVLETGEVADLGAQPDRGERVDAAQAAQLRDRLGPGRERDELAIIPSTVSRRMTSASIAPR